MQLLGPLACLCLLSVTTTVVQADTDLIFIGPGFRSYCEPEVISDTPLDCPLPHYPYFGDNVDMGGAMGAVINDMVTICGGWYPDPIWNDTMADSHIVDACYYYDASTKAWEEFPNMLRDRSESASVVLPDGRWWILGGFGANGPLDSTEIFADGFWLPGPKLPAKWSSGCNVQLGDFTLLAGGVPITNRTWLFDWNTTEFIEVRGLSAPRDDLSCIALDDKTVMATGGYSYSHGGFDTVEIFNLESRTWTLGDPLPETVQNHRMVKDPNPESEDILMLGGIRSGWDGVGPGLVYRYNADNGWTLDEMKLKWETERFPALIVKDYMMGC